MKNKNKKEESQENPEENEVEEEALEFVQMKYNPTLSSRIICIELENNQKIYLNYTEHSTIKDLINTVIERHEFKMLNFNRANILYSKNFSSLYDLILSFYSDIKPSYENKLNLNVSIDELHKKGLLKSHREPFLIFKENYTPQEYIISKENYQSELKKIKDKNFNYLAKYYNYLPRQAKYVPNLYLAHPELENYFSHNQRGYNEFKIYHRNPLTCEDEKIDWLIYDKESINFLLKMNMLKLKEIASLKYKEGYVFFEDKLQNEKKAYSSAMNLTKSKSLKLSDKQLTKVYLNLIINIAPPDKKKDVISFKMKVTTSTTAYNLIEKMCSKLMVMKKGLVLDIKKKVLKVKGLNDYIFNVNEPFVNYAYFIECVKLNKIPEYLIVDNPLITGESNPNILDFISNEKEDVPIPRSSLIPTNVNFNLLSENNIRENQTRKITVISGPNENKFQDLEKIAYYDKSKDDKKREAYLKTDLRKKAFKPFKKNNNDNNNINDINNLVDDLIKEIDEKTSEYAVRKSIASSTSVITSLSKEIESEKNNKKLLQKENLFLSLNPNGSEFFSLKSKYKQKQSKAKTNKFFNIYKRNSINLNSKKTLEPDYRLKIPRQLKFKPTIDLADIDREFNILFRTAYLNSVFNSNEYDTKNIKTVLLFRFELFCSNHSIGTAKQIRWETNTKVQNPIFNKRIYFERNYNKLPNFCSLFIKVKFIEYDSNGEVFKSNTKFWANYHLFDEDNKLKVGLQKVNLQSKEFSDDAYYCFNDNPDEEKSSKIYFEIENFAVPVEYKIDLSEGKNIKNVQKYNLNDKIYEKLEKINEKSVFEELNNNEKNMLWSNRLGISKMVSYLPRLLQSCNYKKPNVNQELQKIFKNVTNVSIVQAIELLSGSYTNEIIREFAVSVLKKASYTDISYYLLQLIQALKYEKNIDNPLSRFLLEQAVIHPITIGHEFFWHLRAEMDNSEVQKKFGLYLEVFLSKISEPLYKIFKDEDYLLKELVKIAITAKKKVPKEERDKVFKAGLEKINNELRSKNKEISLPLNFKYRIKGINVNKCRIMKSKKKPLWLTFINADPLGEDIVVMLKCGDDLRMDMLTLQIFQAMQALWFENNLKLKMCLYKIICTGDQQGMLEMVTNAETLASIHVKESGAISQFFSKEPIKNWIEKNKVNVSSEEAIDNFLISNVAYCLATFVLGIGDRHNDNIMIKNNGELFHIDFGHFLGHFKYKFGIKRERAPFVFTRQFQNVLGDDNSELYNDFKKKLKTGYRILRKNRDFIVTLLKILLCTGIPELNEKSLRYLEGTLSMKRSDEEAEEFLDRQLAHSLDSVSTKLNFTIHIFAN